MHAIVIHVRAAGRRQTVSVARLEQRLGGARVRARDRFRRRVVHVVVCVDVAVGGEEEVPEPVAVHEVRGFDDAFVRRALVVEDGGWGAEEGGAGGGEALDA